MSNIFFTSDTHAFHKRILEFCPTTRRGSDEVEMTELMVEAWNKRVTPKDTVYHLGDVSWAKEEKTLSYLSRLNGHIFLIKGNHDKSALSATVKGRFMDIRDYFRLRMGDVDVFLFHFPIARWDKCHHGSFHLYGHEHGSFTMPGRCMDVGIDTRMNADMAPWAWEEIYDLLKDKEITGHH